MDARARGGTLYLVPVDLGGGDPRAQLPPATLAVIARLSRFVAEDPKSARRFLVACGYPRPIQSAVIARLDEHTSAAALPALAAPLLAGEDCGLLSEAGCPVIADPGAAFVRLAHERGARVVPLVGPSAILLALMASGLNGQHFVFHGYLPADSRGRAGAVRRLDEAAARSGATQIAIETPYRNEALVRALTEHCRADTLLCVATDLTLDSERVETRTIAYWRRHFPAIGRRPTVFLLSRS